MIRYCPACWAENIYTLGLIGVQQAVPGLAAVLLDGERPLPARLATAEALIELGGAYAWQALHTAAALPHLPRRVVETAIQSEEAL